MRSALRILTFVLVSAAAATATVSAMFSIGRWAHPGQLPMSLMVMVAMPQRLHSLQVNSRAPENYTVAFLGDSTVMSYPKGKTVDDRLQELLISQWAGAGHIHVESFSSLGMAPPGFFLMQDEINSGKPDVAVVTANLSFLRDPLAPRFQQPKLAGWVDIDRIYDTLVGLDMYKYGVTADRLLLYKLFVETKMTGHWLMQTHKRAHLGHLRKAVASVLADETGWTGEVTIDTERALRRYSNFHVPGERKRLNREGVERRTAEFMSGIETSHWMMEILEALLKSFDEVGTRTVLYVPPINVEHYRRMGAYNGSGLARTLQSLEHIALKTGAEFADLHDLLPDGGFRDSGGHFTHEPPLDGPMLVAEALAPYVLIQARAAAQSR